jgi:hypothetical protein
VLQVFVFNKGFVFSFVFLKTHEIQLQI